MRDVTDALWAALGVLEDLSIPYALMGGLAVRIHGIPRATFDVDFTISLDRERLGSLFDSLDTAGFEIPEIYRTGWVDEIAGMALVKARLYLSTHSTDVDIFLAESPFQQEMLNRRIDVEAEGRHVWIVSVEDLILLKLIANRPRDQADIMDIRVVQGELDEAYLREWASALGIEDRLETMLTQPPL